MYSMTVSRQHVALSAASQAPKYLPKSQCPLSSLFAQPFALYLFSPSTILLPFLSDLCQIGKEKRFLSPSKIPVIDAAKVIKNRNVYCTYIPNIVQHWINVSIFFPIKIIGKRTAFYWSYDDLHQLMFCCFMLFLFSEQQGKFHYYRKTPQMLLLISYKFWRLVVVFSSLLLSHSLSLLQEQSE